jgi:HD domain
MTVPGRTDAARLLVSLDPPPWFTRHACAVAEVAGWLAHRAATSAPTLDRRLVESAALLHDVDKILPPGDPATRLAHGDGSAAWLTSLGHAELASAVAAHPVTRLLDDAADTWLVEAPLADRIVAYADKRAASRLVPMRDRFADWRRRYGGWDAARTQALDSRAAELERLVCEAANVRPEDVRRLPWARTAIRVAERERRAA